MDLFETTCAAPRLHLVVIDDDLAFGRILAHSVDKSDIHVSHATSFPLPLEGDEEPRPVDVLAIDYHLGEIDGLALATATARQFPDLPIVLISHGQEVLRQSPWPRNIMGFVSKDLGPAAVIEAALVAYRSHQLRSRHQAAGVSRSSCGNT
jgi:DNA-binding NtrC family response regulator